MAAMKIQTMKSLFEEMRAVARGDILAPPDANRPSMEPGCELPPEPTTKRRNRPRIERKNTPPENSHRSIGLTRVALQVTSKS